jgi:hypothetical protein
LAFGGANPAVSATTESWNGTTWTEVNDLNSARRYMGSAGVQTSALAFGGFTTAPTAVTEFWNGTSWTEVNDLAAARTNMSGGGAGTATQALAAGGFQVLHQIQHPPKNGQYLNMLLKHSQLLNT